MIITEIAVLSKTRRTVVLEDGQRFPLYLSELRDLDCQVGEELSSDTLRQIFEELLPARAKNRCLYLLKDRDYTARQLSEKLTQGGYPQEVIEQVIAELTAEGFVNDRRYAERYIESHLQDRTRLRIETDLMRRGIPKEMVRELYAEVEERQSADSDGEGTLTSSVNIDGAADPIPRMSSELALAVRLLEKRHYNADTADFSEKQKMYGYLYRKGFPADIISQALRSCGAEGVM